MAIGDFDIDDAGRMLRAVPEPGWAAVEPTVLAAIRGTPRGGWPLSVADPEFDHPAGVIRVSDLVVTAMISRALADDGDYTVEQIEALSEGQVLQGISIQISGRYQVDLSAAAARVSARAERVVAEVIGPGNDIPVTVTVIDVHR